MNDYNFNIKYQNHFKLYVPLKDHIIFEYALQKNSIDFHVDKYQILLNEDKRYFFKDSDKPIIDRILIQNEIIASTETIIIGDYRDGKKTIKIYLFISLIVSVLLAVIMIYDYL